MRLNPLKHRLAARQPCVGVWLDIPSPFSARLLARLPLDWLIVDTEHVPVNDETLAHMVAGVAEAQGPVPLVRVPHANLITLKRALDLGAYGVVAPMVNTRLEAEQIVAWTKFPPQGQRGYGSFYAGLTFDQTMTEYLHQANQQTLVIIQIESQAALDNLDAIFSVPGIDLAFVGPADLSVSLGLEPQAENQHPRFLEALSEIQQAAQRHNLPLGIFCSSGQAAAERIRQGFVFVNVAIDSHVLPHSVQLELEAFNGSVNGNGLSPRT